MFSIVVVCVITSQFVSYVDESGTTHYVDSPNQVPARYRKKTKVTEGEVSTVDARRPSEREQRAAREKAEAQAPLYEKVTVRGADTKSAASAAQRPDPNSNEERRRKYDEARSRPMQMKTVCQIKGGRPVCKQMPVVENDGLQAGESCRGTGASCAIPPECCSNNCNKDTSTCE